MSLLQNTWKEISNWGVGNQFSNSVSSEIKLSNQLSIVSLVLTITLFVVSYFSLNQVFALSLFAFFFLFVSVLILNLFRANSLSRFMLSVVPNLILFFPALIFEDVEKANFQAFTYLSVVFGFIPFLLINQKTEKNKLILCFTINVISLSIYSYLLPNLFSKEQFISFQFYFENTPQVLLLLCLGLFFLLNQKKVNGRYRELEENLIKEKSRTREIIFGKNLLEKENEKLKLKSSSLISKNKTVAEQASVLMQLTKNEFVQKGIITGALDEVTRTICLTLNISRVSIWTVETEKITCIKQYSKVENSFYEGFTVDINTVESFSQMLNNKENLVVNNAKKSIVLNELFNVNILSNSVESVICMPYFSNEELIGFVMCEELGVAKIWSKEDVKLVSDAVGVISISYFSNEIRTETETIKKQHAKILAQNEFIESQKEEILARNKSLELGRMELQRSLDDFYKIKDELGKKDAEARSILDALNDHNLVVEYDIKGEVTWMNERTMELTHISKKDLEGSYKYSIKSLLLRSNHFTHAEYDSFWSSILRGVSRKYELQIVLPGYNKIWVAATFLPIKNKEDEVYKLLAMAHDISTVKNQQKHIEEQNEQLKEKRKEISRVNNSLEHRVEERTEQLAQQNDQLKEYAFINAHLLRAPVCNILGLIDLLKKYEFSEDQIDIIKFLDSSTKELDEMVMKINRSIKKGYYDDPELLEQVESFKKRQERSKLKRA